MSHGSGALTDVVLVLDVGTGSGRAALVDRTGSVRVQSSHRHSLSPAADGSGAIDALGLLEALANDIRSVLDAGNDAGLRVVAVTATSVRGAFVLLAEDGTPIWATGSLDDRAGDQVTLLMPHEDAFHVASGQRLSFAAAPRLRGLAARDPGTWRRARLMLTLDAWIGYWLTGVAAMPASSAAPTGLLHRDAPAWLDPGPEPWRPTEAERALLPPLVTSGACIGDTRAGILPVGPEAGIRTARSRFDLPASGLPAGIPVAAGAGDAQLAALGLGGVAPGDATLVMGSHWQVLLVLDRPVALPAPARLIQAPVAGTWHADRVVLRVGLELDARWPRSTTTDDATAWRRTLAEGSRAAADALTRMRSLVPTLPIPTGLRVGGGASRDAQVRDAIETAFGVAATTGTSHESSVLGAAMCGGVAAGWADSVEGMVSSMIPSRPPIAPTPSSSSSREA